MLARQTLYQLSHLQSPSFMHLYYILLSFIVSTILSLAFLWIQLWNHGFFFPQLHSELPLQGPWMLREIPILLLASLLKFDDLNCLEIKLNITSLSTRVSTTPCFQQHLLMREVTLTHV